MSYLVTIAVLIRTESSTRVLWLAPKEHAYCTTPLLLFGQAGPLFKVLRLTPDARKSNMLL